MFKNSNLNRVSSLVHIDTGEGRGRHSKSHSERDEVDLEH